MGTFDLGALRQVMRELERGVTVVTHPTERDRVAEALDGLGIKVKDHVFVPAGTAFVLRREPFVANFELSLAELPTLATLGDALRQELVREMREHALRESLRARSPFAFTASTA